jgi:hypothetical protein
MGSYARVGFIRKRAGLIRKLWGVPDLLLASRDKFLGEESDGFVKVVFLLRSVFGLGILATVAFAYPGYTTPMSALWASPANTPANEVSALKLAQNTVTTALWATLIVLLCSLLFTVPITLLMRPGHRLAMLRSMRFPPIAFVLFWGFMGLLTGILTLLDPVFNSNPKSVLIAGAQLIISTILVFTFIPIFLAWYLKAIYLAAVDVFRADDAHPLFAPVATTVVSWTLASVAWHAGGPTGVPHSLSWWLVFVGPAVVSALNIWACWRLWRKYHDLLFRDGPAKRGQKIPRVADGGGRGNREFIVVGAGIAVLGPLITVLFILITHLVTIPGLPSAATPPPGGAEGATQTASFTIPDGGNDTDTMTLSPDSKLLALQVADATADGPTSTIYLFDVATQKQLRTFSTTGVPPRGLFAFGPGDATLTEVTSGGPVFQWDLSTGKRTTIMAATTVNAAISADGQTLATGSGASVVIWNLRTGARIADLTSPDKHGLDPQYAISLDGNGERAAAGYPDGKAYVWNVATGKVIAALPDAEYTDNGKPSVRLSPDGKTAEVPGADAAPPTLWDIATQSDVTPHDPHWPAKPSVLQADYPNADDFSTDSQAYVTNSQPFDDTGNVANVWNLQAHTHIATVSFPGGGTYYVEALGPAGRELLTYGYDGSDNNNGTLTIWTIH